MYISVKTLTPLFLTFDGIVVHDHGLKELGAVTLQRLLIVVECVRPEIRYVPVSTFKWLGYDENVYIRDKVALQKSTKESCSPEVG